MKKGVNNFPIINQWQIVRPPEEIKNNKIVITYTFQDDYDSKKTKMLVPTINKYGRNFQHNFYRRIDTNKKALSLLEEVLSSVEDPSKLSFLIGVESLSDRMLQHMNKGITVRNIIDTLNLLIKYNCIVYLSTIWGWNVLTKQDIINFDKALDEIDCSKLSIIIQRLKVPFYFENRFVEEFGGCRKVYVPQVMPEIKHPRAPMFRREGFAWLYALPPEQDMLNCQGLDMVTSHPWQRIQYSH